MAEFNGGARKSWGVHETVTAALVASLIGSNVYMINRADKLQSDMKNIQSSIQTELAAFRDSTMAGSVATRRTMDDLRNQFDDAKTRFAADNTRTSKAAKLHAEALAKKLAEEQEQGKQEVYNKLGEVKQSADETSTKVAGLLTDVSTVRTEVNETKSALDETIGNLRTMKGDMGVQSGLIATNAKELSALRELGERNYVEFNLQKSKEPQKLGNITVQVKKTDVKRNKFTIDVIADDKRMEKRDRTINEPVQFYVARARQPYELVVNEVKNDRIIGYIATPKAQQSR
jgi:uncharacterized protein YlxW (UPF0749 family)